MHSDTIVISPPFVLCSWVEFSVENLAEYTELTLAIIQGQLTPAFPRSSHGLTTGPCFGRNLTHDLGDTVPLGKNSVPENSLRLYIYIQ